MWNDWWTAHRLEFYMAPVWIAVVITVWVAMCWREKRK